MTRGERFQAVFDANSRAILAYALRRTPSAEDASEVLAETMLIAWRRLDEIPDVEVRLWLFGVANRVVANVVRGDRRRARLAGKLAASVREAIVAAPADAVDTGDAVRAALATLSADERELVQLVSWDGLTPGEAAVVLSLHPTTARTRLHKARAKLRELLADAERRTTDGHVVLLPVGTQPAARTKDEGR